MTTFEEILQALENLKHSAADVLNLASENAGNHGAADAWQHELNQLEGDISDAEDVLKRAGWRQKEV